MSRPDSFLARTLAPLAGSLWIFFLIWSCLLAAVWSLGIGEVELAQQIKNPGLLAALQTVVRILDPVWIILATLHLYSALLQSEGLSRARQWALGAFVIATLIAWASVKTQLPLGPIHFTKRLGKTLGPVPVALPLLWITVVLSARQTALWLRPRAAQVQIALLTALLVLLTDFNLEPLAWKLRGWWLWYPANTAAPADPPWTNSATWILAGFVGAFLLRAENCAPKPRSAKPGTWMQPVLVFGILNGICLLTHIVQRLR